MAERRYVSERRTSRYRDGWRYMDKWGPGVPVKVLPERLVREPDSFDDGGTYLFEVIAPSAATPDLSKAIRDTFSDSNCTHEHDCCGCARTYANVLHRHGRRYTVSMSVSYNY